MTLKQGFHYPTKIINQQFFEQKLSLQFFENEANRYPWHISLSKTYDGTPYSDASSGSCCHWIDSTQEPYLHFNILK